MFLHNSESKISQWWVLIEKLFCLKLTQGPVVLQKTVCFVYLPPPQKKNHCPEFSLPNLYFSALSKRYQDTHTKKKNAALFLHHFGSECITKTEPKVAQMSYLLWFSDCVSTYTGTANTKITKKGPSPNDLQVMPRRHLPGWEVCFPRAHFLIRLK